MTPMKSAAAYGRTSLEPLSLEMLEISSRPGSLSAFHKRQHCGENDRKLKRVVKMAA